MIYDIPNEVEACDVWLYFLKLKFWLLFILDYDNAGLGLNISSKFIFIYIYLLLIYNIYYFVNNNKNI